MAIFIALFFQVLFVFFAMAINVGMVVHDKINLQNSVDLAAYYAAARQGEILNQIAHINYQMRQNYKLFTWRFRVLGSMGQETHPFNNRTPNTVGGEGPANMFIPVYCVAHLYWNEYAQIDPRSTMCRSSNISLPNIPRLTGGTGIVPGFGNLQNFVDTTRTQFGNQCSEAGIFNWLMAARMLAHYRIDGRTRKQMIQTLSDLLTQPGDSFQDLRGQFVREGVEKTLINNLTAANNNDSLQIEFFNSMGEGGCNTREAWLPGILINPVISFLDADGSNVDQGCQGERIPNRANVIRQVTSGQQNLPSGFAQFPQYQANNGILVQHWLGEPDEQTTQLHSSIGFEKNPWCMVYAGVQATTTVQKPFSPTGGGVRLTARGYAKPFGGRIGPWYGTTWPVGSPNSVGSGNDRVDTLLPSRTVAGAQQGGNPDLDTANYSRFPGDTLGMISMRAVSAMAPQAAPLMARQSAMSWSGYNHLGGGPNLRQTGDSLARTGNTAPVQRPYELAATAPDAFDMTYYSVEPSYFDNYFNQNTTNGGAALPEESRIYDFGSTKDGAENSPQNYRIMQSIENAQQATGGAVNDYLVSDWRHLLTSWHQESAATYGLDTGKFGACPGPVTDREFPTYGNCIVGGRTGYGVKNVSRDFLLNGPHNYGGDGAGGSILNPPPF